MSDEKKPHVFISGSSTDFTPCICGPLADIPQTIIAIGHYLKAEFENHDIQDDLEVDIRIQHLTDAEVAAITENGGAS